MAEGTKDISEVATEWLIRLRDGTAEDGEQFVEWLEADPMHSKAFDEVEAADRFADGLQPSAARLLPGPKKATQPRRAGRRAFLGWSAAATVAALAGYWALLPDRQLYSIVTAAGERRSISLADGRPIVMKRRTRR